MAAADFRGFTLIELMTGIAILALLFLLGMPSFITFLRNSEIRSTSESLINGLRTASARAAQLNCHVAFTLTDTAGSWQIRPMTCDVDTDCTSFAPGNPIQQFAAQETRSSALVTVTPGGQSSVCFTGLGRVLTTGGHIQQLDIAAATAGEGGRPLRIIVDDPAPPAGGPRGMRMCDPALSALTDPRAC
jgi:type IV fimbrial biogenesis protein FimT